MQRGAQQEGEECSAGSVSICSTVIAVVVGHCTPALHVRQLSVACSIFICNLAGLCYSIHPGLQADLFILPPLQLVPVLAENLPKVLQNWGLPLSEHDKVVVVQASCTAPTSLLVSSRMHSY